MINIIKEINIMNKKIGIITFQRAHNYGAILQCYALQEYLKTLHYDVAIIDYIPQWMKEGYSYKNYKLYNISHPRFALKNIFYFNRRFKRYMAFDKFINKHLMLSSAQALNNLEKDFDIIIIGSDQVWNPIETKGYDYYYWGCFKCNKHPKIIAYAVSMGGSYKNADWKKINSYLDNFDNIGVRENYLSIAIEKHCKRKVTWVIDPTLLVSNTFWASKIAPINIQKPYLFFYQARNNRKAIQYAKEIARRMNLEFICLSAYILSHNSKSVVDVDPFNFLGLIKNASYVITSSFHGTVFCIQFKKDFITLKLEDGEDGRSESLLRLIGLGNRLVKLYDVSKLDKIEWDSVYFDLNKFINKSKKFLTDSIG